MGASPPPSSPPNAAPFAWSNFDAVLFDLDGVITPTALVHEQAWAALFADYDYRDADYLAFIDGKPRYDGVATFLGSRGIELPWGSPDDGPGTETVCGLGNKKNDLFMEILEAKPLEAYPGTLAVLDLLDEAATPQAIVSSSRNARRVLSAAGLSSRFPVVVDGVTAAEENLEGKPHPAMFHRGAELLGVARTGCLVVEDAVAGVRAGADGGFRFVLGVDRGGNREALTDAGADLVVADLAETLDH
jgi:HAD superfamily hydrolase (TIGR01509 family)